MPVYLFTFHAHGSWMPDRSRGYVQRKRGILPHDANMAQRYRDRQTHPNITFDQNLQQRLIEASREAAEYQNLSLHAVATDPSHAHLVVSWADVRKTLAVRTNLKQSLTRRLNESHSKNVWFSKGGSQKRIRDRRHLDHLVRRYLPSHRGVFWSDSVA